MNGTFRSKFGSLIGVLYAGHSSCRFLVYAARNAEVLTCHEERLEISSPHSGWVELDPAQIWRAANECVERAVQNLILLDIDPRDVLAVGICNQRETSVLWDSETGQPLCNAIGWCDTRTSKVVKELLVRVKGKINFLKEVCGLPFANCFSAVKIRWMLDHLKDDELSGIELMFGTLDSWIMWNLTGGVNGGVHVTDVTNASRTMLMNLETLQWDSRLCHFFKIPQNILPEIKSCSEVYGYVSQGSLSGIPIAGCIGDQQAALLGQMCLSAGQLSCNLDEGCFVLFNTAQEIIDSDNGLLSTVAFKLGPNADTYYALEGAIPHAGSSISWMHENLQLPNDSNHNGSLTQSFRVEPALLSSVCSMNSSFGGYTSEAGNFRNPNYEVILVPAFSGYYTPYWRYKVRGILFGITLQTSAQQILFSAYEAVCFQVREVLESLAKDCKSWPTVTKLVAGGDLSEKPFLMQMLADLSGVSIERPQSSTPACLGTMLAAGLAADVLTLDEFRASCIPPIDYYSSTHNSSQRDMKFRKWKLAVDRCLNFESISETDLSKFQQEELDPEYSVRCSIPGGVYLISSFAIIVLAQILQQNRSA